MFSVSEYLARIERALLDILAEKKPINKSITLWWGLDGLRLNEDDTTEWVSRKEAASDPIPSGGLLVGMLRNNRFDQTQSTKACVEELMIQSAAMQTQSLQSARDAKSANMENLLQQCCVQTEVHYPSYFYGGCCRIS